MEYCTGGTVKSKLVAKWTNDNVLGLPEETVAPLMANDAEAFIYLHETQGLVHCDLKAENVVEDASRLAKMCDFGQSFYLQDGLETITWGTNGYLPPEVLQNAEYGEKVDVYAFGVMVHCLLLGTTPKHRDLDSLNLGDMTEPTKRLIEDCVRRNPSQRPSFRMLLSYEFLGGTSSGPSKAKRPRDKDGEEGDDEHPQKRPAVSTSLSPAAVNCVLTPSVAPCAQSPATPSPSAIASSAFHCQLPFLSPVLQKCPDVKFRSGSTDLSTISSPSAPSSGQQSSVESPS